MTLDSPRESAPTESLRDFVARFPGVFSLEGDGDRTTNAAHDQLPKPEHGQTGSTVQEIINQPANYDVSIPEGGDNATGTSEAVEDPSYPPSGPRLQVSGEKAAVEHGEAMDEARVPVASVSTKEASSRHLARIRSVPVPIDPSSLSPRTVETKIPPKQPPRSRGARSVDFDSTDPNAVINGWRTCHGLTWRSVIVKLPADEVSSTACLMCLC